MAHSICTEDAINQGFKISTDKKEVFALIQCGGNGYTIKSLSPRTAITLSGDFNRDLTVVGGLVNLKENVSVPGRLSVNVSELVLEGALTAPGGLYIKSDKIIEFRSGNISTGDLTIEGKNVVNRVEINSNQFTLKSETITNNEDSIISSNGDIKFIGFNEVTNKGIIRSNKDLTFQGGKVNNFKSTKIFSNGIFRADLASMEDSSTTVARVAALYFVKDRVDFFPGNSILTKDFITKSDHVVVRPESSFQLINSGQFISNTALGMDFSGKVRSQKILSDPEQYLYTLQSFDWAMAPTFQLSGWNSGLTKPSAPGLRFLSTYGKMKAKSFVINSDKELKIKSKDLDLDGTIINRDANILIEAEQAKIKGYISNQNIVDIDAKGKLDIAANIFSDKFFAKADEVTVSADGKIIAKTSAIIASKKDADILGEVMIGADLFAGKKTMQEVSEAFSKLSPAEQSKYRLSIRSEDGDVTFGNDSVLRYLIGDFKGNDKVTRLGNVQGLYATVEGKKIEEGGIVNVISDDYKTDAIKFRGTNKSFHLKINGIKSVTFEKGADVNADTINITRSKDLITEDGSRITGANVLLEADQVKIDGALTALATLGIKGSTLKIGSTANVESSEKAIIDTTDYVGIDGAMKSDIVQITQAKDIVTKDGSKMTGVSIVLNGDRIKINGKIETAKELGLSGQTIDISASGSIDSKGKVIIDSTESIGIDGSVKSDIVNLLNAKELNASSGSRIEGGDVTITADQIKLNGIVSALSNLALTGTNIKVSTSGNIDSKGNLIVDAADSAVIAGNLKAADLLSIKSKQILIDGLVAGMGQVSVNGSDKVKINGSVDSNGNTFITAGELATVDASNIKGENVSLDVDKNLEINGKIISNKKTTIKLAEGDFAKVRGSIDSGGWVAFDGKINSDEVLKLVTGNNGTVSSQGIQVITTEPVIIKRNIESTRGIGIEAKSLEVSSGTTVSGTDVSLKSNEGDLTLKAGSTITGTNSVYIGAKGGDIIREGKLVDGSPVFSSIIAGSGGVQIETDGTYRDQASQTKTSGTLVLYAKSGLVVVPLEYVTQSQRVEKGSFKKRTITTTSTVYYNTTMEATGGVLIQTDGLADVTNLDINSEKKALIGPDNSEISIKRLHNSVNTVTKSAWRNGFKPLGKVIDEGSRMADDAKKITGKVVKLEQNILKTMTRPITKNIPAANKIMDRIYKVQNYSADILTDLINPKKIYKVDTYKRCFDGVKQELVDSIADVQKIKTKVIKSVVARALKNVSTDLANMTVKIDKSLDKGVSYAEAAASFENITRIALVTVATAMGGGPAGAAFANVLADKYIAKTKVTLESAMKSMATGMAAGYASQYVTNLGTAHKLSSTITSMSGQVAGKLGADAANIIVNHTKYTPRDFVTSVLTGGVNGAITANIGIDTAKNRSIDRFMSSTLTAAVTGANTEAIREIVHENRLDLDDVAEASMQNFSRSVVENTVEMGVKTTIPDKLKGIIDLNLHAPVEKPDLATQVAETLQGFKEALPELLEGIEAINEDDIDGESADRTSGPKLSEDQKATLDKFLKDQDKKAQQEFKKKFGVESIEKLSKDQRNSKEFKEYLQCQMDRANGSLGNYQDLQAVVDALNKDDRTPAGLAAKDEATKRVLLQLIKSGGPQAAESFMGKLLLGAAAPIIGVGSIIHDAVAPSELGADDDKSASEYLEDRLAEIKAAKDNVQKPLPQPDLNDPESKLLYKRALEEKNGNAARLAYLNHESEKSQAKYSGSKPKLNYEANPKHKPTASGNASPAPTNPVETLNRSVEFSTNSTRRVAVDPKTGEFVVFAQHEVGKGNYHGYQVKWEELTEAMKSALIKSGQVNHRGKIL
ncbi:MAG: hypothetical protein HQK52_23265 [Oligoflexia bacterium]|nr:hypothetical protein [Oligoflexia bacterium]